MRDLIKRLERLESSPINTEPPRVIRQIVSPSASGPVYHFDRATCGGETIVRPTDESREGFELRALSHFTPGKRIVIHA